MPEKMIKRTKKQENPITKASNKDGNKKCQEYKKEYERKDKKSR